VGFDTAIDGEAMVELGRLEAIWFGFLGLFIVNDLFHIIKIDCLEYSFVPMIDSLRVLLLTVSILLLPNAVQIQ
jgi:hypothetical protein